MIAWFRQGLTIQTLREAFTVLLASVALVAIMVTRMPVLSDRIPNPRGLLVFSIVLAFMAAVLIFAPYWPFHRLVKTQTPRTHVLAVWEARAALCALREVGADHWVLVSIRHVKDRPLHRGTTAVVVYDPDVHGVVVVVVGGAGFPLAKPVQLPLGINPPRPRTYLDVEDTRKMRTLLKEVV